MTLSKHRPQSATHWLTATAGLAGFLASLIILRTLQPFGSGEEAVIPASFLVTGLPAAAIILVDIFCIRIYRRSSTGLDFSKPTPSLNRTLCKLLGLYATLGLVAALYWLLPEYRGSFYDRYYNMLKLILPWWALLAIPYFYCIDRHMVKPEDGYWQLGQAILLRWERVDKNILKQHFLAWGVKAYFLALMYTYLCKDLASFLVFDFNTLTSFPSIFDFFSKYFYFLDVSLVSMSYLLSLRIIDTHFRSTEPTILGWVAALLCYQPFWSLVGSMYFAYKIAPLWGAWLWDYSIAYGLWGSSILALITCYVWATIMFGARFSNLTHRGIITNGPYRLTKHPAYIAKNLSYWLISVPFITQNGDIDVAVRHCLLLLGVNLIYLLRAKTEEWHLSKDPVYIDYAMWVDQHGIFRWINHIPIIKFTRYKLPSTI